MAKLLADRDIRKLIGSVLLNAEEKYLNPNGIELRLGEHVLFHSTGEEGKLEPGFFLKVNPGESVIISSIEHIDFSAEVVQGHFAGKSLMGLITPTTTMMREGISQVTTKIDAGFRGVLNWGLRNGSTKDLVLQYGEPIFKLTLLLLAEDETPELAYGQRETDSYQDAEGIRRSSRRIPADIPKSKMVSSSFDKLDPKKQLREAGYPFDHIGTELVALDGKFELVSKDVLLLKEQFQKQGGELARKIEQETSTLSGKLEETRVQLLERVEAIFDRKFTSIVGVLIGALSLMYAGGTFLQQKDVGSDVIALLATVVGIAILAITFVLGKKAK